MNKKNKIFSVSSIFTLLLCLVAAVIVWLFAKYNITHEAEAMVNEIYHLIA